MFSEIKKRVVLILMCLGITLFCAYTMFHHYLHSGNQDDIITSLETFLLDQRILIRGPVQPKSKIGILAFDEKSITAFGRWPFSRRYMGVALSNLKKLGVKWIGFDAIFSEKENPTVEDAAGLLEEIKTSNQPQNLNDTLAKISELKDLAPGDKAFVDGVKEFKNIVLGYFFFESQKEVIESGKQDNPYEGFASMKPSAIDTVIFPDGKDFSSYPNSMVARGLITNTPYISKSSENFAFFSNQADSDAIVRWVTLVKIIDSNLMPSLSLKVSAEAMNRNIVAFFDNNGIESLELINRENDNDSIKIPIDPLGHGRILANHRGPSKSFRHFSLADAYQNSLTEDEKNYLKDSILLAGATATGINDQRPNPFDPALDGVENHATVIDNILNQDFLRRPREIYNIEMIIIILIGLLFSPILIFSKALVSGFIALAFLIGYYYFDKLYWFDRGIWAYMGMPFIEILTLFITVTFYKYIREEKEKRKVKGAFAHYLSPEVIDQVLQHPDNLQLGGERKELTVFFSDVRGFTTISESLTPEKLCEFMNEYFTPMTSLILKSRGVLDKYIGDAIMAFWGAPIPLPEHADIAADASIQMLYALDKLQADFKTKNLPNVDIGIGLNTGPMSVGNMGSDERFCYTVMGDSVNLGSRLEGLTKEYGIKIMVSEFTVANFKQKHHFYRDLDDIRVKGKNEPIKVYHLMRPDLLSGDANKIRELIQMFEEGRKFYRDQNWSKSKNTFSQCLKLYPDDGPSKVYLTRIEEFETQNFIPNWDGVYTFTHK